MEPEASEGESSTESEFGTTVKYLDLYLRQKTDLYLQHYVFEPFDFLGKKLMYLAVLVSLLAAGTLVILAGLILFIATFVPLWAALLISGVAIFLAGYIIAYVFFSEKIVLQTPTATEVMNRGKT